MVRGLGVSLVVALVAATTAAGAGVPLKAFARARHSYDTLPAAAKTLAPNVVNSRRVATAVDTKKNQYLVYVTLMKNKTVCDVLTQGSSYTSRCVPQVFLFETGRETLSIVKGLIGGVAANDVVRLQLVGGKKKQALQMTSDHGYIFGCPAPSTCAGWVKTIVGYNAAGKIVSRETIP